MKKTKRYDRASHTAKQDMSMILWSFFIAGSVVAVGVIIAISLTMPSGQEANSGASATLTSTTEPSHYPQGTVMRTITFVSSSTELDTDKDHAHVAIVQGHLPSGTVVHQVTVLSDENCMPDSPGISHCLNRISYGSSEMTVRHNHRMGDVPCLQPGEVLQVV